MAELLVDLVSDLLATVVVVVMVVDVVVVVAWGVVAVSGQVTFRATMENPKIISSQILLASLSVSVN